MATKARELGRQTLAVKSNRSLSGATREPLWSASPSSFLSEKFNTCVAV